MRKLTCHRTKCCLPLLKTCVVCRFQVPRDGFLPHPMFPRDGFDSEGMLMLRAQAQGCKSRDAVRRFDVSAVAFFATFWE